MNEQLAIPKHWKIVDVSSLGRIETGSTPSKQNSIFYNNDFPFYKPSDLAAKNNVISASDNLSEAGMKQARLLPEKSILVTCIGATIGKTGMIKKAGASNQQINAIIPSNDFDPNFIYYQVISPAFQKLIKDNASATTLPILNKKKFQSLPFVTAPLSEQQQIVSKIEELFSELDKGIEELKTAQQQLKVYRQAVLKWAFEGKLTNKVLNCDVCDEDDVHDNSNNHVYHINHKNHSSDKGELPEGWTWVKIENIAESLDYKRKPINKNEREKRKGIIPYYGANGRTGWIDDFLFDEPLILVVEDETFTGRELPFSYKIVGKSWVNNHAHILKPYDGTLIDFLNYQLSHYPFLPIVTGTTGRKKLTKNALINAPIKICSIQEQHQIVQEIESRLSVCDKMEETITISMKQAEALRQSILKQAFEGKLV